MLRLRLPQLPPFPEEIEAVLMVSGSRIFAIDYDEFRRAQPTEWLRGTRRVILRNGEELSLEQFKQRRLRQKEVEIQLQRLEKGLTTLRALIEFLVRFSDELEETSTDRRQKLRGMTEGFIEGEWTQIIPSELFRADYETIVDVFMRLSRHGIFRVASLDTVYAAVYGEITLCQGALASYGGWLQDVNRERRNGLPANRLTAIRNEVVGKQDDVHHRLQQTGANLNSMRVKVWHLWQGIQQDFQTVNLPVEEVGPYLARQVELFWRLPTDNPEDWNVETARTILYGPYCVYLKDSASFYEKHWRTLERLDYELNHPDLMEIGSPVLSVN